MNPVNTIALTLCLEDLRNSPDAGMTVRASEIPKCRACGEPMRLIWGRHSGLWRLWCRCSPETATGATEREAIANYQTP